MDRIKILFVCLGNICRSPLAEAIFNQKVKDKNLSLYVEADSCGTSNYQIGDPPDRRTVQNAKRNGVHVDHVGRQLCKMDLENFDVIVAMDQRNHQHILELFNEHKLEGNVLMMREFDEQGKGLEVPDPYHKNEDSFQEVFDILNRSMDQFIIHLEENHLPKIKARSKSAE